MASNCGRVIGTVRGWGPIPPGTAISRADVLIDLWLRHGQHGVAFCTDAVNDLIRRLVDEFRNPPAVHLKLLAADFCPPDLPLLKTVGDLCDAVDQSEAAQ